MTPDFTFRSSKNLRIFVRLGFCLLGWAVCPSLWSQVTAYPLQDQLPANALGVYSLPSTQLKIRVTVRTTEFEAGEFALYAQRYLDLKDVCTENYCRHELAGIAVSTAYRADHQRRYYLLGNADNLVHTSPEGFLLGVNVPASELRYSSPVLISTDVESPDKREQPAPRSGYTEEMQMANSSAKSAQLAAKQIFGLRDTRLAALQGEIDNLPSDGEGFQLYLDELDKTERDFMALFCGRSRIRETVVEFDITPDREPCREVLFRFSADEGLLPADDLSGRPIYLDIAPREGEPICQEPDSALVGKGRKAQWEKLPAGLYYYQPHLSAVSLTDDETTWYRGRLSFAQLGDLLHLKSSPEMKAVLDPATGSLIGR